MISSGFGSRDFSSDQGSPAPVAWWRRNPDASSRPGIAINSRELQAIAAVFRWPIEAGGAFSGKSLRLLTFRSAACATPRRDVRNGGDMRLQNLLLPGNGMGVA